MKHPRSPLARRDAPRLAFPPARPAGRRIARAALATVVALAALLAAPRAARAQQGQAAADSLISLALERARAGDTTAALKALERATKVAPEYAPAFYQRGVLLSRTTSLGMSDVLRRRTASQQLKRALDLDANNPFYLMELGRLRLKTPFLRLDAERLFNRALRAAQQRRDPRVLAEIYWELGQIHERRYSTTANRRIITTSAARFDPTVAIADWHYTADFLGQMSSPVPGSGELDFRKAEDHYRASLLADPSHEGAALGLLSLLYEAGRFEEMQQTAQGLLPSQPKSARLRLALGLALHRLDRDVDAEPVFDTALALLPAADRRDMTSLETILRQDDAKTYRRASDGSRLATDSLYWEVQDPLALTRVNEARVEFLSRVAFADMRFTSHEFGTKGWKTDRGITHIRYGPPPVIATFSPETQEIEGSDAIAKVTTVWWYPESKLRFVFVGPPAMNYAIFADEFRSYAENVRHLAPVSFDNLAPRIRVDSVPVQVARFRADSLSSAVDVSFFAELPTREMLRDVDVATGSLETALFVSDDARNRVAAVRDSVIVRADAREPRLSRSWRRVLPPGSYLYRVEARENASGRSARGRSGFDVEPFAPGALSASDVLIARRVVPRAAVAEPRGRNDFLIVPNASMRFAPGDTIYLYWETYGLVPDSLRTGRMRIEIGLRLGAVDRGREFSARVLGGFADAVGLSEKGEDRVALRYERSVTIDSSDRVPNYLALALGGAPYGTYDLELTVTDLTTGKATTRTRTITVPRR